MTTKTDNWRERLAAWRAARSMTQKAAAEAFRLKVERIRCSQQTVNALESGARIPSPKLARRIDDVTDGYVSRCEMRPDVFGPRMTNAA